jgi:hypothetical protein
LASLWSDGTLTRWTALPNFLAIAFAFPFGPALPGRTDGHAARPSCAQPSAARTTSAPHSSCAALYLRRALPARRRIASGDPVFARNSNFEFKAQISKIKR